MKLNHPNEKKNNNIGHTVCADILRISNSKVGKRDRQDTVITGRSTPYPPGGQTPLGFSRLALFPANRAVSPARAPWADGGEGAVGQVAGRACAAGRGPEREGPTGVVAGPARLGPLSRFWSLLSVAKAIGFVTPRPAVRAGEATILSFAASAMAHSKSARLSQKTPRSARNATWNNSLYGQLQRTLKRRVRCARCLQEATRQSSLLVRGLPGGACGLLAPPLTPCVLSSQPQAAAPWPEAWRSHEEQSCGAANLGLSCFLNAAV